MNLPLEPLQDRKPLIDPKLQIKPELVETKSDVTVKVEEKTYDGLAAALGKMRGDGAKVGGEGTAVVVCGMHICACIKLEYR